MSIHFKTIDPLGRSIHCTKDRWYNHILLHRRWLEDANWEANVKKALEEPMFITQDNNFLDRDCYYYHPSENAFYLKVVVKFTSIKNGEVITAYELNEVEQEKIIWSPLLSQ